MRSPPHHSLDAEPMLITRPSVSNAASGAVSGTSSIASSAPGLVGDHGGAGPPGRADRPARVASSIRWPVGFWKSGIT